MAGPPWALTSVHDGTRWSRWVPIDGMEGYPRGGQDRGERQVQEEKAGDFIEQGPRIDGPQAGCGLVVDEWPAEHAWTFIGRANHDTPE